MMKKKKKSLKIRFRFRKKKKASDDNIDKNDNTNKKDKNNTLKKKGKKRKRRKKPSGHTEHWTLRDDDNNNIYEEEEDDIDDKTHAKDVPEILHNSRFEKDYNKKGKIGIYTPAQRRALLQKFREKRRRRVWYKKVRYGCRKNLADRRLRIKGRFVRADSQEYKDYFANLAKKAAEEKEIPEKAQEKLSVIIEEQVTSSDSNSTNTTSMMTESFSCAFSGISFSSAAFFAVSLTLVKVSILSPTEHLSDLMHSELFFAASAPSLFPKASRNLYIAKFANSSNCLMSLFRASGSSLAAASFLSPPPKPGNLGISIALTELNVKIIQSASNLINVQLEIILRL
jgi:hypothetical protein